MSPRRLDAGAIVAAAGGVTLLVSLFLDWYGDRDEGYTAWTVFEVIDLLLALTGLLAISAFVNRAEIERRAPDVPLLILGGAALALVVSQLVNHPPAATELDPDTGAWVALAGAALLLAGAIMSAARISLAVSVEHRDRAGAVEPAVRSAQNQPAPEGRSQSQDETVRLTDPPPPAAPERPA